MGLLWLATTLSGCGNEAPRDLRPCPKVKFELCDLFEPECQAKVYHHSECARDYAGRGMPPVQTITRDDYREQLTAPSESSSSKKKEREDKMTTKAFQLLGLLDARVTSHHQADIELQVTSTLAYYSITDKAITLIDHQKRTSSAQRRRNQLVLAHEFTHAQQDEAHDLESFFELKFDASTDGYYAWRSLLEAEANLSEELVANLDTDAPLSAIPLRALVSALVVRQAAFAQQPQYPYSVSLRNFPYSTAYAFVAERYLSEGMSGVRALYKEPRTTMLDFMRPHDAPAVQRIQLNFGPPSTRVSQENSPRLLDRMGAWFFYTALLRNGIAQPWAYTTALAWRGDSMALHADAQGSDVAIMWRIALPSLDDSQRKQLAASLNAHVANAGGAHHAFLFQEELVWVLTQDANQLQDWVEEARDQVGQTQYSLADIQLRPFPRRIMDGEGPWTRRHRCPRAPR